MRCFIAIDFPDKIKKEVVNIQKKLPEFRGKLTEFENLHLTLKFLGEIDEEKIMEIKKKLKEIKFQEFEAEIDSIGFFSEDFIKIVWLHIKNCDELQKKIDEKLKELFPKEKRFMSHLTIARVKNVQDKKRFIEELREIKIPNLNFNVESFNLNQSILTEEKPVYKTIEKFNLKI